MCRKLGLLLEIGMAVTNEDGRWSRWPDSGQPCLQPIFFHLQSLFEKSRAE